MDFTPGALAATYVSTDARTFKEPPPAWQPTNTNDRTTWFGGSPQSLVGDLIREGVTGVAGQVSEPYLQSAVRPDILFPAYVAGFNLIESFYMATPHLSWQTVIVGDPLCAPFPRKAVPAGDIDGGIDPEFDLPVFFARRRLEEFIRRMPGVEPRAAALAMRADILLGRNDRAGARRLFEEATALSPKAVQLRMSLADLLTVDGAYDAAADQYQQVLALEPDNIVALNNLAYDMAVRQKKPAEAAGLARKALALSPKNFTIMDTVGWIEFLLGNTAQASRMLAEAAKGAPRNADIRLHNAIVLAAQGARGNAETELAEALKLNPGLDTRSEVVELRSRLGVKPN
jgi:tetratricopeptide (TPR) repeat protein